MEKKSYESIFFEVEKDLTKPNKHMSYNKIEDIFSWKKTIKIIEKKDVNILMNFFKDNIKINQKMLQWKY